MKTLALLLALLVSCGSFQQGKIYDIAPENSIITNYKINESVSAAIGNPLISVSNINGTFYYEAIEDFTAQARYLSDKPITINKGELFTVSGFEYDGKKSLLITNHNCKIDSMIMYLSITENGKIDLGWINRFRQRSTPGAAWDYSKQYFRKSDKIDGENFRWELVYQGKSGSTVKLLYREFMNNIIRDKFNQELEYNLAEDSTFAYKNLVGKFIKATNTQAELLIIKE